MLAVGTWLLLCVTFVTSFVYLFMKLFYRKRRPGEPPIVKGNLVLGSSLDFGTHAVNFLHRCQRDHGDIFTIRLINQHLTILMDPHSYEAMAKERNFDFDAIQRQVNWNVFSFVLKEPRKIIKDTARTVRGNYLLRNMEQFSEALDEAFSRVHAEGQKMMQSAPSDEGENLWSMGLREFTAATMFDPLFTTIFGRSDDRTRFNWREVYQNFEIFHQYFNFMWLGLPKKLFPAAMESLGELLDQPTAAELLSRSDSSAYIKTAIEYMMKRGQTESEIKGHNLVYLHVNYNTFRLSFWVLNNIIMDNKCYQALVDEVRDAIKERTDESTNTATFTMADVEGLKVLDSVINESMRLSSGVFMVRHVTEDTWFQTTDGKDHLVRGGDRIAIYPPAIHKDPEIFEEPLTFKYDRFIDAKFYKNGRQVKHPVIAFGSLCPGKRYALLQLRWYIMSVFARYDLSFPAGGAPAEYDYQYHGHEILPPVADVNCRCTPRQTAPTLVFEGQ